MVIKFDEQNMHFISGGYTFNELRSLCKCSLGIPVGHRRFSISSDLPRSPFSLLEQMRLREDNHPSTDTSSCCCVINEAASIGIVIRAKSHRSSPEKIICYHKQLICCSLLNNVANILVSSFSLVRPLVGFAYTVRIKIGQIWMDTATASERLSHHNPQITRRHSIPLYWLLLPPPSNISLRRLSLQYIGRYIYTIENDHQMAHKPLLPFGATARKATQRIGNHLRKSVHRIVDLSRNLFESLKRTH